MLESLEAENQQGIKVNFCDVHIFLSQSLLENAPHSYSVIKLLLYKKYIYGNNAGCHIS